MSRLWTAPTLPFHGTSPFLGIHAARSQPPGRAKREFISGGRRGYSRDHRPDCKQVRLALVVTREGMPLGYEVFAGNRTDVTTVEEIVDAMEARYGVAQRIWVMDRGMTSEDNLQWLRTGGRQYLVGTPKSELRKWARQIADARDWRTVRDGVEAKPCVGPDGHETFVLIRSVERREKERAMHARFCRRIEGGLTGLGQRLARARRPLDRSRLERGRPRVAPAVYRATGPAQAALLDRLGLDLPERLRIPATLAETPVV